VWPRFNAALNGREFASRVQRYLAGRTHETLLNPDMGRLALQREQDMPVKAPQGIDALNRYLYTSLIQTSIPELLHYEDRNSMAYSIEARVPFLDHELVEFCARIPPWVKMKWLREKHILRRAMEGVLPPDIVNRKKRGLQVPMDTWLRAPLPEFAAERLSGPALTQSGYFDPGKVAALLRRHRAGSENFGQILSVVLGVQVWDDLFRHSASGGQLAP
jgi:asparagine synthase (glutamine-hydrolysing)